MRKGRRKSYWEKLQDPRWQLKKVELFDLYGGYCHYPGCEHQHLQLDVHHKCYLRNTDPWDYPDWCFQILCKVHHAIEQDRMEKAHQAIASNPELIQYCISHRIENPPILKCDPPTARLIEKEKLVTMEEGKNLFQSMREAIARDL